MIRCEHCQADVPANARFCPSCATPVSSSSQMPTALEPPSPVRFPSSSVRTPSGIDAAPFAPGQMLGDRYRIVGLLGRGGMGEVFRADDLRLGQPVALKFLPKHLSSDPARLERFHAEVRNAREVAHPHVCRVYDIGDADGRYFLSMEYVDGEDLGTLLRRIGRLPPAKAVEIARQVCAGLAAAHERGVIHRDLKPQNIMLDGHGRARITDFGLAVRGDEAVAGGAGTPAYMSPEQADGKALDARSDVFSFGAVLYEMLSGTRAFAGDTTAQILSAVLRDDPPRLNSSSALEGIVRRCLAKQPLDRFQTMQELKAALEGATAKASDPERSIAVLPFENMSGDKENEYFSDGLTEEIINLLTRIPRLKVIARTSAFAFKGKHEDVRRIAEALGVTNVLEGSVRKAGSRIRVAAQLIAAADGSHVWSERYDRELADVFAVQDEIAAAIANALQLTFSPESISVQRHTPALPAYEHYLKALYESQRQTPESMARAQKHFERALEIDPEFAVAHAEFGHFFHRLAIYGFMPPREALQQVAADAAGSDALGLITRAREQGPSATSDPAATLLAAINLAAMLQIRVARVV
jgi:serine/threonine protein kinase